MFNKKGAKELKHYLNSTNYYNLLCMISGMFEYKDEFPDYLKSVFIETQLLRKGFCAVLDNRDVDGEFKIGMVSGFDYNDYLEPIGKCSFYTRWKEYGEHEIGKDVAIIYNNKLRLPDLKVLQASANLTEIETSKRVAIVNTRFTNIPIVNDQTVKDALDLIIKDVLEGKYITAVKNDNFLELINETSGKMHTLELTDPKDVDKLQYIYKCYDDEMRDFLEFYGQTYSATAKMAQVNSDELQGGFNFSKVIPYNMLTAREESIRELNKIFKVNWSVDFSEPWQHLRKQTINGEEKAPDEDPENEGEEMLENEHTENENT